MTGGKGAVEPGRLILLRHGQTAWSQSGQYTGRTDIPLTDEGERQAAAAGRRLREAFPNGFDESHVFVSPLRRAQQTARLAGFESFRTSVDLPEWDYGRAEGRSGRAVSDAVGHAWNVWREGPETLPQSLAGDWEEDLPQGERVSVHAGKGESVEDVAARTRRVLAQVEPLRAQGEDVLLVAHAHVLRILTTQWLGLDPRVGCQFRLDTAHFAVLGRYHGDSVVVTWNR